MRSEVTIFDFESYQKFLKEVVAENTAKKGKEFGYRYLSTQLEWPPTYLNDLVNKRKKISVAKAWELALYLELVPLERDYLTLMVLTESTNKTLQTHAKDSLRDWKFIQTYPIEDPNMSFHYNILVPFLKSLLRMMPVDLRYDEKIIEWAQDTPVGDQFTPTDILFTLGIMVEMKVLSKEKALYVIEKKKTLIMGEAVNDPSSPFRMRSLFQSYARCWEGFLKNRTTENFHLKSSFGVLTFSQLKMLAKKIDELRNLTLSFEEENFKKNIQPKDLRMIQYNYNVLEVLAGEKGAPAADPVKLPARASRQR